MTAADRPSVTDNARAEAIEAAATQFDHLYRDGLIPKRAVLADLAEWADRSRRGIRPNGRDWAAGRAETTTALPRPGDGCQCTWHNEDRGGGHYELVAEYEPACPEHSEHVWNPRTGMWEHRAETTTATTEDAARVIDALGRHWWSTQTGETEPWDDLTDSEKANVIENAYIDVLATPVLGLLATARAETTTATDEDALADLAHLILDALHFEPSTRDAEMDDVMDVLRRHLLATARTRPTRQQLIDVLREHDPENYGGRGAVAWYYEAQADAVLALLEGGGDQ